jgi:hypothetical protein
VDMVSVKPTGREAMRGAGVYRGSGGSSDSTASAECTCTTMSNGVPSVESSARRTSLYTHKVGNSMLCFVGGR